MSDSKLYYGEVIWFNSAKGFGFLSWSDENGVQQPDMFCHFSDLSMNGYKTLYKGQKVSFCVGANNKGQPKAVNVNILMN